MHLLGTNILHEKPLDYKHSKQSLYKLMFVNYYLINCYNKATEIVDKSKATGSLSKLLD